MRLIWASIAASVVLVGVYLLAGGADYKPTEVRDPCLPREWRDPDGLDELGQQLVLSGLDGAACELGVTRERLARAMAGDAERKQFMRENSISEEEFDAAVRSGLDRMVDDAERAGEIGGLIATGLRALIRVIPAGEAFDLLMDARPLLERALGAGSDLNIPGLGSQGDGDGSDFGDGLREQLEGLGDQLDRGLKRLREGLSRAGEPDPSAR